MWELYFEGEGIERKRTAGQSKAQTWSLIQFGTIPLFLVSGPLCSLLFSALEIFHVILWKVCGILGYVC